MHAFVYLCVYNKCMSMCIVSLTAASMHVHVFLYSCLCQQQTPLSHACASSPCMSFVVRVC